MNQKLLTVIVYSAFFLFVLNCFLFANDNDQTNKTQTSYISTDEQELNSPSEQNQTSNDIIESNNSEAEKRVNNDKSDDNQLNQQMYTKDQMAEAIANALSEKNILIAKKDQLISTMVTQEAMEKMIANKDQIISDKDQIISDKDQIIESMISLDQLNEAINQVKDDLNRKLALKDAIIKSMLTKEQCDRQITQIKNDNDVIIAEKNNDINNLNQIIEKKDQMISRMVSYTQLRKAVREAEDKKDQIIKRLNSFLYAIANFQVNVSQINTHDE